MPRFRGQSILLSALLLAVFVPSVFGQGPTEETILILNSYHRGKEFQDNIMDGIERTLRNARPDARLCFEYMDTNVYRPETVFPKLKELYALKYKGADLDLIILSDNSALDFVLANRDELFPGVPVVFCGINGFEDSMIAGQKGITGVVELLDQKSTIKLALRLHPNTRHVVTLSDATKTATLMREGLRKDFHDLGIDARMKVTDIVSEDLEEIKRNLAEFSPEDTLLFHASFTRENHGRPLSVATRWGLSKDSGIPCYSPYSYSIGHGPVGGHVMDGHLHGETAARMGLRILDGESPEAIPIVRVTPTLPKFDYDAMVLAGVRKKDLPAGSVIIDEPSSLYARHKNLVWGLVGGNAFLLFLLSILAASIMRRKKAERALRESREKHRSAREEWERTFDAVPHLIAILDLDRRIVRANRAMAQRMNRPPRECVGVVPCEFFHSSPETVDDCPCASLLSDAQEHTLEIHDDKSDEYFLVTVAPLHDATGNLTGFVHMARDLTERRRLEEKLRQAQKMEAIGQLAGGVAHDFNNLLQAIQGYGEMAFEASAPGSQIHTELGEIMKATERATALVRQLLAFSRRQVLELRILDLSEVVGNLTDMIHRVIGEHIVLNTGPGLNPAVVCADRGQMEQVLVNLCVNARDAMPEGGEIAIATDSVDLDESFCQDHTDARPGCYAMLCVADTGSGIDATIQERIFEPFFTTKGTGRGTGLGLSTVYGIVRQHDGFMDVQSEVGRGTTFRIYFPAAQDRAAAHEPPKDSPPAGGTETILLAEDEETVRNLAERVLSGAGYTVLTAKDGEDALRMSDTYAGRIHLALLDVVMPGLGGKAVLHHMRDRRPETRILFASGYSAETVHTDFLLSEGVQLVQKPYQCDTLLRKVREVLDKP